jgi:hypothetical protein
MFPVYKKINTFVVTYGLLLTDECSFSVTVTDAQKPTASCLPNTTLAGNKPAANNQDVFFMFGGDDNCGVSIFLVVDSVSEHHFAPYDDGTNFRYVEAMKAQRGVLYQPHLLAFSVLNSRQSRILRRCIEKLHAVHPTYRK